MFKSLTKGKGRKSLSQGDTATQDPNPMSNLSNGSPTKGSILNRESNASSSLSSSVRGDGPVSRSSVQEGYSCEVLDTVEKKLNHWINGGYWICVTLKEARNLGAYDYDTQSSDPFAKLRLTLPGEKAPVISEHRTRTVHRNLSPMFEERLLCPLSGLSPACMFHLSLYDADWLRAEFMGQVRQSLGQLLEAIEDVDTPSEPKWYSLMGKKPKNACEGEVQLQAELMTYSQAEQHRRNQEKFKRPEFLEARFIDTQLELGAQSLLFSHRVKDAKAIGDFLGKASIEVRVGQSMIRQPIRPRVKDGLKGEERLELVMEDKIIIPLHDAFHGSIMVFDKKASSETSMSGASVITAVKFCQQLPLSTSHAFVLQHAQTNQYEEGSSPQQSRKSTSSGPLGKANSTPVKGVPCPASNAANLGKADSTPSCTSNGGKNEPISVSEARTRSVLWKGQPRTQADCGLLVASDHMHTHYFARHMEHYSAEKAKLPWCQLGFTLNIVPRQVVSAGGPSGEEGDCVGCTVLDVCEDQEDERDAPPLKNVPAPLESKVMEANFPCGPCKSDVTAFWVKYSPTLGPQKTSDIDPMNQEIGCDVLREGLTKMDIGPWGLSSCADGKQSRQRTWKYTKPLNIPVPFAPKIADVIEVHTLQIKEVSGWLLEIVITTDAPKGDTFKVVNQVLCMRGSSAGSCSLRVTMMVDFLKNVGFLKSAIQGGALKDTVTHWDKEVSAVLRATLAGESPDAAAADAKAEVAPLPSSAAPAPKQGFPPLLLPGLMALGVLLLIGLLFSLAYTGWQSLLRVQQGMLEAMELLVKAQEQLVSLQAAHADQQCSQGSLQ
ncbi:hypothetical protein DUNSADRAFT_6186 [Dunaliella salina]|uniref:C2 domain-containing protein n=1 Tax=Dunaliella salina TaxID=3046 RepID=A0ABQ7GNV4_DUNSA|nr:hypothetical protein DUNSADRAFT_6186 [Dunaliella salina]|eukprot:KAF5836278.1 hypothetical protein DUNSADRAFT_6186 [Dunaliella salina]